MATKKENITYVGDIRLIGLIVDPNNTKNTIGYVVYIEKQAKVQLVSKPIMLQLIKRYKFSNVEAKYNDIQCTECSLDNFPKYISDGSKIVKCLDPNKIYIIGEIIRNNKVAGYRVISSNGNVTDLSEKDTLASVNKGFTLVNAHIRDNKALVPNKEKNFNTIVQLVADTTDTNAKTLDHRVYNNYGNKTSENHKKSYLKRLVQFSISKSLKLPLPMGSYDYRKSVNYECNKNICIDNPSLQLAMKKFALILKNEVYPCAKTDDERKYILDVIKDLTEHIKSSNKLSAEDIIKIKSVCTFLFRLNIHIYSRSNTTEYAICAYSLFRIMAMHNIDEVYLPKEVCSNIKEEVFNHLTESKFRKINRSGLSIDVYENKLKLVAYNKHNSDYVKNVIKQDHLSIGTLVVLDNVITTSYNIYCKSQYLLKLKNNRNLDFAFYDKYHITIKDLENYYQKKLDIIVVDSSSKNFIRMMNRTVFRKSDIQFTNGHFINCEDNEFIIGSSDTTTVISNNLAYSGKELWTYWLTNYVSNMVGVKLHYMNGDVDPSDYVYDIDTKIQLIVTLMSLFEYDKLISLPILNSKNVNNKNKLLTGHTLLNEDKVNSINTYTLDKDTIDSIKDQEDLTDLLNYYNNPLHIKLSNNKYIYIGHISRHINLNVHTISDIEVPDISYVKLSEYVTINKEINKILENIVTQLILITGLSEEQVVKAIVGLPLYNIKKID